MPSSVMIFTVTKLRPGLQMMTFASVIFMVGSLCASTKRYTMARSAGYRVRLGNATRTRFDFIG
jgi:hydrogenase-4 membrane subunit HyfE